MISIIIPVYNEAEIIEANLKQLQQNISSSKLVREILVIDGGSKDETRDKAQQVEGVEVYRCSKGRPRQMNYGATKAKSDLLYFLHIDALPPTDFDELIMNSVENGHKAGCFKMRFESQHLWLRFLSWMTRFKARSCRGGDQSLFVTKALFNKVGGYDETFMIYEDHEILKLIYDQTDFDVIQENITTSARRFKTRGILRLQLLFWMVYFKKWMGASPEELFRFYQSYINNEPRKEKNKHSLNKL